MRRAGPIIVGVFVIFSQGEQTYKIAYPDAITKQDVDATPNKNWDSYQIVSQGVYDASPVPSATYDPVSAAGRQMASPSCDQFVDAYMQQHIGNTKPMMDFVEKYNSEVQKYGTNAAAIPEVLP